LGSVPPLATGAGPPGTTVEGIGAAPFGVSGGNTTRGPDLAFRSTGVSSRGTIFSVPSPEAIRSGTFVVPSAGAGMIFVGPASALMIGGSPLRAEPV
jgi:hypothetical protein